MARKKKHYAQKGLTQTSDFFDSFSETTEDKITLKHYKSIVWNKLLHDSDPNDRHIKEWTAPWVRAKRLLLDMELEGAIKIRYINDKGCVRRVCTPIKNIYDYTST